MWAGLDLVFTNIGMPFENVMLIIAFLGGLMFIAKDFRIGSIYYLVIGAGSFLWFFRLAQMGEDVNWSFSLVFLLLAFAFMVLNLINIKQNEGVVV